MYITQQHLFACVITFSSFHFSDHILDQTSNTSCILTNIPLTKWTTLNPPTPLLWWGGGGEGSGVIEKDMLISQ